MSTTAPDHIDAGTGERTEFAWHRTGLALAGIGLGVVRSALPAVRARPAVGALLIGVGTLLAVAAALARVYARRRGMSRRAHLRGATAATLIVGMLAFAVAVTTA
jgi:uncharacterized membrane protein YidH (DUF202 family)